jgi:hypothetical protein
MRTSSAAIFAAMSLGVAGCGSDATSLDTAPMGVVRAAQSSMQASGTRSQPARAARRSGVTPRSAAEDTPTPAGPPRPRTAEPARALPVSAAAGLAAAACEQHRQAQAGRFPAVVRTRGDARALAVVTDGVAAALLGMPVVAPRAGLAARAELGEAAARLSRALARNDDATATATAQATGPRIRDYAHALGIAGCG